MNIQKIAAFSDENQGGNPAGVLISDQLSTNAEMQKIALDVGFSETVFATPISEGWKVHYFSPESEVPFCGHATIALGAALALRYGNGIFSLTLTNQTKITVEGTIDGSTIMAALQSPPTNSFKADPLLIADALSLFGYMESDLDYRIPPALIHGGSNHLVLALNSRSKLKSMKYDLDKGRTLMNENSLVTILLVYAESDQLFHTRNPFASGGIYEDSATGAATAALGGYLRDLNWPHKGHIDIVQGEDMGMRSKLRAEIGNIAGSSIRVSGTARIM
ncbi:PhzF family phenazine biosynthesis protein [Bacteriovorax antarcticus]